MQKLFIRIDDDIPIQTGISYILEVIKDGRISTKGSFCKCTVIKDCVILAGKTEMRNDNFLVTRDTNRTNIVKQ